MMGSYNFRQAIMDYKEAGFYGLCRISCDFAAIDQFTVE